MYTLEWIIKESRNALKEMDGNWVPARPVILPFTMRLRAAWWVLTGKADAFIWPEKQ